MAFEKGKPKTGGRQKGVQNKMSRIKEKLDGTLTKKDYNDIIDFKNDLLRLAKELLKDAKNVQEKRAIFDSLSKYVFIPMTKSENTNIEISFEEWLKQQP
jgi:hypothetical protein